MPSTCARSSSASNRALSMPRSVNNCAAFCASGIAVSGTGAGRLELLRFTRGLQRVDELIQIAVQHALQIVRRQTDAVVGYAALRKVVRANLSRAIPGADLRAAVARALRFLRRQPGVE